MNQPIFLSPEYQELIKIRENARALIAAGQEDEAVELYATKFATRPREAPWNAAYCDALLKDLFKLQVPHELRTRLSGRRNEIEKKLISNKAPFSEIQEWCFMNFYLGEKNREIQVLERFLADKELSPAIREFLVKRNINHLVGRREYHHVAPYLNDLKMELLAEITKSNLPLSFEQLSDNQHAVKYHRDRAKEQGALVCEIALAVGRESFACEVLEAILSLSPSEIELRNLVDAAVRFRSHEISCRVEQYLST